MFLKLRLSPSVDYSLVSYFCVACSIYLREIPTEFEERTSTCSMFVCVWAVSEMGEQGGDSKRNGGGEIDRRG
jgi:hypothetical protein